MKFTGIVRKMDPLGRIVIPKDLRRTLGISEGDPIEVFTEADKIILRKYNPGCVVCGSMYQLATIETVILCRSCADRFVRKEESR